MNKPERIMLNLAIFLLILLWTYAAVSKLAEFHYFQLQMKRQHLPGWLTAVLPWVLPAAELTCTLLLTWPRWRLPGLYLSALLLCCFTVYVGMALANVFGRMPCSCGGVIGALHWRGHLVFNLFFLLLSTTGIFILNRERRARDK